jgi:hypothetical protein
MDTHWWHEYVLHQAEVRFIRGRIKFNGIDNSAHLFLRKCLMVEEF